MKRGPRGPLFYLSRASRTWLLLLRQILIIAYCATIHLAVHTVATDTDLHERAAAASAAGRGACRGRIAPGVVRACRAGIRRAVRGRRPRARGARYGRFHPSVRTQVSRTAVVLGRTSRTYITGGAKHIISRACSRARRTVGSGPARRLGRGVDRTPASGRALRICSGRTRRAVRTACARRNGGRAGAIGASLAILISSRTRRAV